MARTDNLLTETALVQIFCNAVLLCAIRIALKNKILMSLRLKDKIAIVTGAGHPRGMGYASCKRLADQGARLVMTDLPTEADNEVDVHARAAEIVQQGGQAIACIVDVTQRDQIDQCVSTASEAFGGVDILFNNAGTPIGCGPFLDMNDHQWDLTYRVNLKGVADFCQAVIPAMKKRGGGTIINNSSLAGLGVTTEMAAYNASKFAVVGLTKSIAVEFGPDNIRCNAVCPGAIDTRMGDEAVEIFMESGKSKAEVLEEIKAGIPLQRWASADEVAQAVVYLAGPDSSFITGVALPVAGGMAQGL